MLVNFYHFSPSLPFFPLVLTITPHYVYNSSVRVFTFLVENMVSLSLSLSFSLSLFLSIHRSLPLFSPHEHEDIFAISQYNEECTFFFLFPRPHCHRFINGWGFFYSLCLLS